MMNPTEEERIKFWGLSYARTSIIEAQDCITELRKGDQTPVSSNALVTTLIVAYCRLFTEVRLPSGKKVWPLSKADVPQELSSTHEDLMVLRNKVFGHKDAGEVDDAGNGLNRVIFRVQPGSVDIHTIVPIQLSGSQLEKTGLVCKQLLERIEKEMRQFSAKYLKIDVLSRGEYEMLLTEVDGQWIRRLR